MIRVITDSGKLLILLFAFSASQQRVNSETFKGSHEHFQRGVGFKESENKPDWSLEMDFEEVIRFSTEDGLVLNTPPVKVTRAMGADVTFYDARTESGELRITLSGEKCIDPITGKELDYLTRIEAKYSSEDEFRSFTGCGRYIFDYRLHDIWVLKEMTGVNLDPETLTKGLPVFELNPGRYEFTGHAGCNNLNARIEVRGNRVSFGKIISTRMACPDMSLEQTMVSKIEDNTFIFKIHEGILTLEDESGAMVYFRKID